MSIKRQYANFAGVDFKNDEGFVNLNRSPDALNVYKNYTSEGGCIETRPGYVELADFTDKINGLHIYSSSVVLVHAGAKLYLWNNFPNAPQNPTVLSATMNDAKSMSFIFNNKLYINDGSNYLVYDGTLRSVSQDAYIPTTSIGRKPAGGGTIYQRVYLQRHIRPLEHR